MQKDVISYYARVFPKLKKFLKKREMATITSLERTEIVKRGSHDKPLYINEVIKGLNKKFLELRKGDSHLKDIKPRLTKNQINIWNYFVPRKLIELHYAVNQEHPNRPLQRIYFDIDRLDIPAEKAQLVAIKLIETIKKDSSFRLKYKIFPMWTGNSFHIYLLLNNEISRSFYENNIHVDINKPKASFTGRWAIKINRELKNIKVVPGHERKTGFITIDPSQSPSGKIARCPFSLYIKGHSTIKGIALPLTIQDLKNKNLIKELRTYTMEKVIKNLNKLAKKLP